MSKGRARWDWELKEDLKDYYNKYEGDIVKIAEVMGLNYVSVQSAISRFITNTAGINKKQEEFRKKKHKLLSRVEV